MRSFPAVHEISGNVQNGDCRGRVSMLRVPRVKRPARRIRSMTMGIVEETVLPQSASSMGICSSGTPIRCCNCTSIL